MCSSSRYVHPLLLFARPGHWRCEADVDDGAAGGFRDRLCRDPAVYLVCCMPQTPAWRPVNRDAIMYHAIIFNKDIDAAMELLSEVVLEPELSQEEV